MTSFVALKQIDFDNVRTDVFWNIGDEKEDCIHKIHNYPAKFPAFITQKAISFAKKLNIAPKKIADIFCGCGTVALESKREGVSFWGCDINPVATLIAEVKSGNYDIDLLQKYKKQILETFQSDISSFNYLDANERIRYWFYENTFIQLSRLKSAINSINYPDEIYKKFFYVLFPTFSNLHQNGLLNPLSHK